MSLEEQTKIYRWNNEKGSDKDLVYIPSDIKNDSSFPISKEEVTIRINREEDRLEIEDA